MYMYLAHICVSDSNPAKAAEHQKPRSRKRAERTKKTFALVTESNEVALPSISELSSYAHPVVLLRVMISRCVCFVILNISQRCYLRAPTQL
jgi:hypothetical protein